MQLLRPTSSPAMTALIYITVGTLVMVWTTVFGIYRVNNPIDGDAGHFYWIAGFLATGLMLVIIGLAMGQIGRSAKPAEAAPPVVATPQPNANAAAPLTAPAPNTPVVPTQIPPNQVPTNQGATNQAAPVAVVPAAGSSGQQLAQAQNNPPVGAI